ncbi:C1 family peptidase [Chryseobacterium sp. Tr-659]|uniref:C1 family peptidase n=1 Tax=Chryseobacterium sp. Tr-659 TaxID=2608340 RepID=UPI0014241638|nr:C1 family peptidase [Chryseobacterium sp. Tr-659]NIF06668.1 C1 family peptidase [Chryseobacterium sp. Tr-659]
MKTKSIIVALSVLTLSACNSNEDMEVEKPIPEPQKQYSLGAKLIDQDTYASFQKADINALTFKFKNKNFESAKKALPGSYFIAGTPIGDQGSEGSCVGWATTYAAASSLELNFKGVNSARSPEYVFNQIKVSNDCQGSYVKDALNLLKNQGACSWTEMPYTDTGCSTLPNAAQKLAASTHKLTNWATVDNTDIAGVKTLLSMDLPVVIAVTVDASFDNMKNTNWIWKSHSGAVRGGHAICVVGYDDTKKAFKVQNSWGNSWGDNGYFWIDYTFFSKSTNLLSILTGKGAIDEAYVAYVE